jgi:hypothetical protein
MIELRNFILKILQISNDYYEPDLDYIKLKYQINTIKEFNSLYSKRSNDLLIFNSNLSEKLFIRLVNLDEKFINRKYNKDINSIIFDIISNKNNNYYLSICDEFYNLNKSNIDSNIFINQIKSHIKNCNCKIRVKSIVNLSINTLIKIIKNTVNNKRNLINNNVKYLKKKIKNSKNNRDIVDCIKILNTIKANIGLEYIDVDNNYIFEKTITENTISCENSQIFKKKYNIKNQFYDTDKISINQLNNNNNNLNNNNFQFETEFNIEDIREINELLKEKIKKNNFNINNNEEFSKDIINEEKSKDIINEEKSKEIINEEFSKDIINEEKSKDIINEEFSKDIINEEKSKDIINEEKSKDIINEEKSIEINSEEKSYEDNKKEMIFNLEELKDYFNSIDDNNIGEIIYGFNILYKIINSYKKNKNFINLINQIMDKIYKQKIFLRETLVIDIDNLIKMLL